MPPNPQPTAAHRIAETLSAEIVDGTLPPHSRLPPVRELAKRFNVNIATIQRVLARLSTLELIEVRHGSGATIRDLSRAAGIELMPLVLATERDPERAGRLLADFLDLRRVLALEIVFRRIAERPHFDVKPLEAAIATLRETIARDPKDHVRIARAEVQVSRTLILAVEHVTVLYVLNDLERLLISNDDLLAASYEDTDEAVRFWERAAELFSRQGTSAEELTALDTAMRAVDRRTVERFVARLRARETPTQENGHP